MADVEEVASAAGGGGDGLLDDLQAGQVLEEVHHRDERDLTIEVEPRRVDLDGVEAGRLGHGDLAGVVVDADSALDAEAADAVLERSAGGTAEIDEVVLREVHGLDRRGHRGRAAYLEQMRTTSGPKRIRLKVVSETKDRKLMPGGWR